MQKTKTIYALWSKGSRGKTTTVKLIANQLYLLYPSATILPDAKSLSEREIVVTIIISKLKIGITSQGDPTTGLYQRLKVFADEGCDIIICTTRTRGETEDAVHDIEKGYGYKAIWFTNFQNGYAIDHPYLNEKSSEALINLMRDMYRF